MLFTTIQRITILPILQKIKPGSLYIHSTLDKLMNDLSLPPEEVEKLGITESDDGRISVPPESTTITKEIEFPEILSKKVSNYISSLDFEKLETGQAWQMWSIWSLLNPGKIPEEPKEKEIEGKAVEE